jgi:Tol biopolymer transport system component
MRYNLFWRGTGRNADIISGPVPPAFDVAIGSRFIVWSERRDGQYDIFAFDLAFETETRLTNTPDVDEREPATSGAWIVWQATRRGVTASSIEARNVDTAAVRTIAPATAGNFAPTADDDLIAWESNAAGNLNVWVYRLSTGESFQVTTETHDQYLNQVFGNKVAYVDARHGTEDVFVAGFRFVPAREP